MKTKSQVLTEIERHLSRSWGAAISLESSWSLEVSLNVPKVLSCHGEAEDILRKSHEWAMWCKDTGVHAIWTTVSDSSEELRCVSKLFVPDALTAAKLISNTWVSRFEAESFKKHILEREFFCPDDVCSVVLRRSSSMSDSEFDLLISVAQWLRDNSDKAKTLTPRQVPVPGIHAKWILSYSDLLGLILGVADLGLRREVHREVSFTYLDPDYLKNQYARKHDSVVLGTVMYPAYTPEIVVISENLDTAIYFPDLKNAISVQGQGSSGADKLYRVELIRNARRLLYWGDLDAQGFEILNRYRETGLNVSSIMMDVETLDTYASMASSFDANGVELKRVERRNLKCLNKSERIAYEMITDPSLDNNSPVRIEQERIPLVDAYREVCRVLKI